MDENTGLLENFESLLKEKASGDCPVLYQRLKTSSNENIRNSEPKQTLTVHDVITNVAKQLKAIQSADCMRSSKKCNINTNRYKTTTFLPVNMLVKEEPPQKKPKFETQPVSDTQLINIVEDAEALDAPSGMTQEFDTTFCHSHVEEEPETETHQNPKFPVLDIRLKEPDPNTSLDHVDSSPQDPNIVDDEQDLQDRTENIDTVAKVDTQFENHTELLNKCMEIEDADDLDVDMKDMSIQEPLSPVFTIKSKKPRSNSASPLVFNLESFEKFESVAQPIIEETADPEIARNLISSQIAEKELFTQADFDPIVNVNRVDQISPIIELNEVLKVDKESLMKNAINNAKIEHLKEKESQSDKFIFQDEILFSSDEEDVFFQRSYQDLPFTCALETSFYDHSDVLDKTMFVGFQTASNKSMQINTDYFSKAKSLLVDIEGDVKKEATLTDLVKICDSNYNMEDSNTTVKQEISDIINVEENVLLNKNPIVKNIEKDYKELEETIKLKVVTEDTEVISPDVKYCDLLNVNVIDKHNSDNVQSLKNENPASCVPIKLEENHFVGFKTASNKVIKLSAKSLEQTKKIFQDIDLNENLQFESISNTKDKPDSNTKALNETISVFSEENNDIYKILGQNNHLTEIDDEIFQEFQEDMAHEDITDIKMEDKIPESEGFKILTKTEEKVQDIDLTDGYDASAKQVSLNSTNELEIIDNYIEKFQYSKISKDKDKQFNKNIELDHVNVGFRTASNKNIEISENAFSKIKNIFNDIELTDDILNSVSNSKEFDDKDKKEKLVSSYCGNQQSASKTFAGFRTANNKEIKISEQAVLKSKNIFQDINLEINNIGKSTSKKAPTSPMVKSNGAEDKELALPGFKTASNKNISISSTALVASKNIFKDLEDLTSFEENSNNSDEIEPPFYGFEHTETAVAAYEEALAKSQKIFEKIEHRDVLSNPNPKKVLDDVQFEKMIENKNTVASFGGFKTASNKDVLISKESLEKCKSIFQDIDKDITIEEPTFKGFLTASNKNIKVSKEALAKSRNIFQDIDEPKTVENINIDPVPKFKGFQTASNKEVKISEEALAKSRKIFQDIDEKKTIEDPVPIFKGFQTASNKEVKISEEALAKSRKIFQEIDEQKTTENINIDNITPNFQTASSKQVKISEEALDKCKKWFQDIDDDVVQKSAGFSHNTEISDTFPAFGFQTANNKEVRISKEALAKSKRIFQDIDEDGPTEKSNKIESIPQYKGFQTASNKKVKVSEEALAKSKKIFQEIEEKKQENENMDCIPQFKGFQTANNKQVNVSREALAKAKNIFQDIDEQKTTESKSIDSVSKFKGFQTGSNKIVRISEEALAKAKNIFQDVEDEKNKSPNFKGFNTASNKRVHVSGTALLRSRKIFENIDLEVPVIDEQFNEHSLSKEKVKNVNDFGFKTGNNNKIDISKEALMRSRELFSKIDDSGDIVSENMAIKESSRNKDSKPQSLHDKDADNIDNIITTQVLNNFEMTLHTEDFFKEVTPKKSKRSGSPILSCPKAKRRKVFQTPYSQTVKKNDNLPEFKPPKAATAANIFSFNPNYKKQKIYTLKDVAKLEKESENLEEKPDPYISNFNFENLLSFKFSRKRNDIDNSTITTLDIKKLFLDSVDKKLVPDGWVDIHLKLIIFKLLSYELKFPKTMNFICSVKSIMEQLKYRYDKELYNAERPALRKIMEKDDIAMKTLVLCVVDIYSDGDSTSLNTELLLSDGWYCIRTLTDRMLTKLVKDQKIKVGTKLLTQGAELVGMEQAVSPWEDTSSIRLKLSGNSTRRASWDARLGYNSAAILTQLSHVSPDGGKVSKVRLYVTRVYPPLYIEKFEDGSTVTRSERLENLHQMKYETERQAQLEKIYEEVEKEIYDQDSQDSECSMPSGSKRKSMDSGSQIAKMMKRSRDPAEFRSHLTSSQRDLLVEHTTRQREKQLQHIQNSVQDRMAKSGLNVCRNVVPLLKIRVAGVEEKRGGVEVSRGMLSIWKPNDAVIEMIREGSWIEVLNVMPTAIRYGEIQMSAGRQSVFIQSKYKETEKLKPYIVSLKRTCYPIKDLIRNPTIGTDYNEIDTAGIIFQIDPSIKEFDSKKHQFQNVFLSDGEKNIICVNFWGGLKKFGFDVLDTGQIVAGMNLQKRAGNTRKNIPQYRVTEFSYFTKTPKNENARKMIDELSKIFYNDRNKFIDDCVNIKHLKLQSNENVSPYRFPNINLNSSKIKVFVDSPLAQKSKKSDDNLNLTGLDFESTFKQAETQELSPKTLMRKKQVKEKIEKLKRYGEPPPLSPMQIKNKSNRAYKSPLILKSDVSPSVASEKEILPNCQNLPNDQIQSSPVICMDRTYVKRSNVNPVKLNFSTNVAMNDTSLNEVLDEFAEEFDGSPPLSLD